MFMVLAAVSDTVKFQQPTFERTFKNSESWSLEVQMRTGSGDRYVKYRLFNPTGSQHEASIGHTFACLREPVKRLDPFDRLTQAIRKLEKDPQLDFTIKHDPETNKTIIIFKE
jgi:hypothetical protein